MKSVDSEIFDVVFTHPNAGFLWDGCGGLATKEQLTLNHRVPGSSPGAPTKLFKHLALIGIRTVSSV
jgi:hypothetical protein